MVEMPSDHGYPSTAQTERGRPLPRLASLSEASSTRARYRPRRLGAVTMPGHLAETRRYESHQTWEASP